MRVNKVPLKLSKYFRDIKSWWFETYIKDFDNLLYMPYIIATLQIRIFFINMFLNYLPHEMIEVMELTIIFSGLVGTILFLLFTADKPNTKNLYMRKAR